MSFFSGPRCDCVNPCFNETCLNRGRCHIKWPLAPPVSSILTGASQIVVEPVMECECADGYVGKKCEVVSPITKKKLECA